MFYDEVADSWYNIRHWSIFQEELEEVGERWEGGKLLNIGCAHGSDFLPLDRKKFDMYGLDVSTNLLSKAKEFSSKFNFSPNLITGDMRNLPFKENAFDNLICIASLHHLLKREDRIQALKEMKRIMKRGAEVLITVWNKRQREFIHRNKTIEKTWNYKGRELKRSYYLYTYREIEGDVKKVGLEVVDIFPEKSYRVPLINEFSKNIIVLARN